MGPYDINVCVDFPKIVGNLVLHKYISDSVDNFTQQIIQAREDEQKLSLAKVCKLFSNWPLLSLKKIAGLIKWRKFPPGQGKRVLTQYL